MAKKNANGAGTIRQRSDGRWEARYTVGFDTGTGKQIQKSVYGKTQKEVRQKLAQVTAEIDKGAYTEPSKMTVASWLRIWLSEYTGNVKPFTLRAYQDRINLHVIPALGAVKLSSLSAPMVQKFINGLGKEHDGKKALAPKTIKNIHGVLHKALLQAVLLEYLRTNPADHCTLPRIERAEIKPLDNEKSSDFLTTAAGDKYYAVFLIDMFTGLRQGEILGLTWDCIDWSTRTITVKQQLQREKKPDGVYYLTSLKNDKTRQIQAAKTVMDALRERRREQALERIAAGIDWRPDIDNLVFTNEFGEHISHTTVRKHFKQIVSKIGMPEARFHDLRHTYAVASIQNGDDVKTVQENLGHFSASFTLDVYGHVTDRMKEDSANRMEEYIKRITG